MWLMTGFGILMPAIRPPKTVARGDLRTMQIRARRKQDLDILRAQYMPSLGATIATPQMDYNFRAYCTPDAFAVAMMKAILDIDYLKFKPTTEDRYGDHELHTVYNRIWSTVCTLNPPGFGRFAGARPPVGKYGTTYPGAPKAKTAAVGAGSTVTSYVSPGRDTTGTGWADDDEYGSGWHRFGDGSWRRNEPEPEVDADGAVDTFDDVEIEAIIAEFDKVQSTDLATLYAELDAMRAELDGDGPMVHSGCSHGISDGARLRCRRRHRRDLAVRVEAMHRRIDRYYDTLDDAVNTGTVIGPASTPAIGAGTEPAPAN